MHDQNLNYKFNLASKIGSSVVVDLLVLQTLSHQKHSKIYKKQNVILQRYELLYIDQKCRSTKNVTTPSPQKSPFQGIVAIVLQFENDLQKYHLTRQNTAIQDLPKYVITFFGYQFLFS
jgi:hypothetical protein